MLRRVLVAGFGLLLIVPPAWIVTEHLRGRRELAAFLEAAGARGEMYDMARLAAAPGDEATGALAEQVTAAQTMSDASALLPSAQRWIAPGVALPPTRVESWNAGPLTNTWEEVAAWVDRHRDDLEALRGVLKAPVRRARLDYSLGFSRLLLPHLAPIKNTATALSLAAMESAHRGALEEALVDLEAIQAVQRDLAEEPLLISQLVRIACVAIANSRVWSVLHAGDWNEAQLARIQAALPPKDLVAPLIRSLEGERAMALAELRSAPTRELASVWGEPGEFLAGATGLGAGWEVPENLGAAMEMVGTLARQLGVSLRSEVVFPLWRFGWGDQAIVYYLETSEALLRAQREGMAASSLAVTEGFDLRSRLRPEELYARLRAVYAGSVLPALTRAETKAFRAETEIALNETAIALRRYQLKEGRLPDSLESLIPAFLPAQPVDRMDGRPLRYRRDGETGFVLWSVGEDLKDDGGDPNPGPNAATLVSWWAARDAVWPRAAEANEIAAWREREAAKEKSSLGVKESLLRRYGLMPSTQGTSPSGPDPGGR